MRIVTYFFLGQYKLVFENLLMSYLLVYDSSYTADIAVVYFVRPVWPTQFTVGQTVDHRKSAMYAIHYLCVIRLLILVLFHHKQIGKYEYLRR